MNARLFTFVGGEIGPWRVVEIKSITGKPIADAKRLNIVNGTVPVEFDVAKWLLRGVTSNERYVTGSVIKKLLFRDVFPESQLIGNGLRLFDHLNSCYLQ